MIRQAQDWSVLSQIGFVPALIWTNLSLAMAPTASWLRWMWIALAVRGDRALRKERRRFPRMRPENNPHTAAFFAGYRFGRGADRLLHFLVDREDADAGLVFSAADNLYCGLHRRRASELARALAGLALGFSGSCARLPCRARVNLVAHRQTNMDLIASVLRERADAHDLIIVHPWTFGVSFDRQYSGPTPWTTVPPPRTIDSIDTICSRRR